MISKNKLESRLLSEGIPEQEIDSLVEGFSQFHVYCDKILDDISYCVNRDGIKDKSNLYKKAVKVLLPYDYPDSRIYLSDELFLKKRDNLMNDLNVLINNTDLPRYVLHLDVSYKISQGKDFLAKILSKDKLSNKYIDTIINEDIKKKMANRYSPY
ncbi:MAG: hypothetical protein BJBARM5_0477 [Candidatus Parvarchaeum acidophilus ARMAN-5]|jgi:hypothetical protein|uniref:Uncharacterized protein n=1 Tax=Candidatus Parvarchaeum acidophilus ARMAN-5 TaxID=662762 RepID=D6GVG4_PARA5|nr:MAG: hypothetical protein BJBARM5_0477 [Candidatus Parvarchaeum acidophilus ARMAN-5]